MPKGVFSRASDVFRHKRNSLIAIEQNSIPEMKEVPHLSGVWAGVDGHIYVQWKGLWWRKKEFLPNSEKYPRHYKMANVPPPEGEKRRPRSVHTMVCEAFHGPRPGADFDVSHEDGNRLNNRPDNLKWRTKAGNQALRKLHGTDDGGTKNTRAKFTPAQVHYIREQYAAGRSIADISREITNATYGTVYGCAVGLRYKNEQVAA